MEHGVGRRELLGGVKAAARVETSRRANARVKMRRRERTGDEGGDSVMVWFGSLRLEWFR
jgi:hypothetical protein